LSIYEEYQDHYPQAETYHSLGKVAMEQEQWEQAEQYYRQSLSIYEEYQDRYSQAGVDFNLGVMRQKQRKWGQAEQYYQQALQVFVESQDRYLQATIYNNLGRMALEQRQWEQARHCLLHALELYMEFDGNFYLTLGNLALLWRESGHADLAATIASVMKWTKNEIEQVFRRILERRDA
jgi:tetratricopeptide (TPR) repeat protein